MTFRRRAYGTGHGYTIDGQKCDGVTTLIKEGCPPKLDRWAARSVAEFVADNIDAVIGMRDMDRDWVATALADVPWSKARAGAAKGTRVHKLAEPLSHGEEVDVPEELAGYVEACVDFLNLWQVEMLATEVPVCNRTWRYGGTPDFFARVVTPGKLYADFLPEPIPAGTPLIVAGDWKTANKGIFADNAWQVAAYRHAETWLDGQEEKPMSTFLLGDIGLGVWLRSDGFDVYPLDVSEASFQGFLYVAKVARLKRDNQRLIGEAVQT